MCGIAGMVGLPPAGTEQMLDSMGRRGPDDRGMYHDGPATLLHARLAIIDPEGGRQPMELDFGGEHYCLVYNGELYNTQELRRELAALGHRFLGHSDTEVLLHAYAQFGADCLEKCNGIFAFAVWERRARRLFLGRDRIGVKPLFYKLHQGGLLFASEMKTILLYPGVEARLDEVGAAQLVLLGPGRLPGSGVFQGIGELEPGCRAFFEDGRLVLTRYWRLKDREHRDSLEETADRVRYLVTDAIRRQMVSDVPIGTFLSGGLDSSIITAVCAKELEARGEVLNTFSVDYENNDRYFKTSKFQPDGDNAYIRIMEKFCHTSHHWTVLTPEDLVAVLEEATIARDLPGMADVDFSLLAFCGQIREKVKVALSGECADEIFGGYPWYRDPEIRAREGFPWAQNTHERTGLMSPALPFRGEDFILDAYAAVCRESDILPGQSPQERRMKEMVNLNFRCFMQTLLDRKDRMSMYNSLEVRVPFCDYRIAEYLYAVPWEMKDHRGREKGLLRHAMEGLLPEQVLYRRKSPYPKTFDPRYEAMVSQRMQALLEDVTAPLWLLVDRTAARTLLSGGSRWPWYGQLMQRPQTMAYFLQMDFWLRHYHINFTF
ncbi:MAG: asparagine synthase (glutamine-hydrolyzing) [Eubacteriales bacterium]|nr:asparagine synthase (glutamine-hydrolyzing) [Eubacteriales bacterium]